MAESLGQTTKDNGQFVLHHVVDVTLCRRRRLAVSLPFGIRALHAVFCSEVVVGESVDSER